MQIIVLYSLLFKRILNMIHHNLSICERTNNAEELMLLTQILFTHILYFFFVGFFDTRFQLLNRFSIWTDSIIMDGLFFEIYIFSFFIICFEINIIKKVFTRAIYETKIRSGMPWYPVYMKYTTYISRRIISPIFIDVSS